MEVTAPSAEIGSSFGVFDWAEARSGNDASARTRLHEAKSNRARDKPGTSDRRIGFFMKRRAAAGTIPLTGLNIYAHIRSIRACRRAGFVGVGSRGRPQRR